MALFSSLIGFFRSFAHRMSRRDVNRRAQQYAEPEWTTIEETDLPEAEVRAEVRKPLDFSAKRGRKVFAKYLLGQGSKTEIRELKRKMKEEIATGVRKEKEMKETSKEQKNKENSDKMSSLQETPPAVEIRPLLSVEEPVIVNRASQTSTLRAGEIRPEITSLPSVGEPARVHRASRCLKPPTAELRPLPSLPKLIKVNRASENSTLRGGEIEHEIGTLPSVGEPVIGNRASQTLTLPAADLRPLPSVGEPVKVHRSSRHLRPPAAELRALPSVPKLIIVNRASENSTLRGGEIEHEIGPLPSVEETLMSESVFQQLIPPAGGIKTLPSVGEPLEVPQNPTSASDEVKFLTRSLSLQSVESLVHLDPPNQNLSCAEVKPQPASSLLGSIPQLLLMEIECEGSEYVEYTGKTISPGEMKAKQHQPLEAGVKPKRLFAWLENESEVQEPAPQTQEVEVQAPTDEDDSEEEELEESKEDTSHVSQKARDMDDHMIKLFCVTTPSGRKTETQRHLKGQEKPRYKGKAPLVLLNWAEKTAREKKEKKKRKRKEEIERQLLLHRYQNDPKLKHLKINKHNPFYNLSLPAADLRPLPSVGEPVKVHRASRHLRPPAAELRPLPSVEETLMSESVFQQVIPPAGGIKTLPSVGEPLEVPQNPTSAPDEVISLTRSLSLQSVESLVHLDPPNQNLSCAEVKPQPASSLFGSVPQLLLMEIECEGSEYVEYTGKTISPGEMKAKQHQPLEAGVKPGRIFAWLENDSEVQEPAPQTQEVEVQAPTDEDDSEEEELEESKEDTSHVSQKARDMDDHMIKLFCVTTPCGLKTETQCHLKGREKPKYKGKAPLVLLTWAEKTAREKKEKKKRKRKEQMERQLLLHRYQTDPKLKHLKINKHNPFYNSSSNSV